MAGAASDMRALFQEEDDGSEASVDFEADVSDAAEVTRVRLGSLELDIAEADCAFGSSGADQSGNVVWGAARLLAAHVAGRSFEGQTVVELGCGCGVAALAASKRGAAEVFATDGSDAVLRRARRNCALNAADRVKVVKFDWADCLDASVPWPGPDALRAVADVVLASDVVYAEDGVPALLAAVAHVAKPDAEVLVATRDGRRGVDLFLAVARDAFRERAPPVVAAAQEPADEEGDGATHSLYAFTNLPPLPDAPLLDADAAAVKADVLRKLDEKRADLAQCKKDMADLQGQLKGLAASVKDEMDTLIATFVQLANGAGLPDGLPPGAPQMDAPAPLDVPDFEADLPDHLDDAAAAAMKRSGALDRPDV